MIARNGVSKLLNLKIKRISINDSDLIDGTIVFMAHKSYSNGKVCPHLILN